MACHYLEKGRKLDYCNASTTIMVPSIYEMKSFCQTEDFKDCHLWVDHVLRNEWKQEAMMTGTPPECHIGS